MTMLRLSTKSYRDCPLAFVPGGALGVQVSGDECQLSCKRDFHEVRVLHEGVGWVGCRPLLTYPTASSLTSTAVAAIEVNG